MGAENHREVEDQAAAWLAKRDAGDWSSKDQARFRAWLEASVAHRVGFLRLEAAWVQARRLKALAAGLPPGSIPDRETWLDNPFFSARLPGGSAERGHEGSEWTVRPAPARSSVPAGSGAAQSVSAPRFRRLAAAAGVLLAIVLAAFIVDEVRGQQYSTPVGGIASVPLQDGSEVTLDTASRVRIELGRRERYVDLMGGEAFFVVAKDARRPFVVAANGKRVVAVGTQFSVRSDPGELRVVVTQGTVRLEGVGRSPGQGRRSAPSDTMLLAAGMVARITNGTATIDKDSPSELEAALSWRRGYLTFRDVTLASAVAEFNRYNMHKITVADPRIAAIHISGTFRPRHPAAFVRLLAEGFAVRAIETGDTTTLSAGPGAAGAAAP
jgi:transmembrane sensor